MDDGLIQDFHYHLNDVHEGVPPSLFGVHPAAHHGHSLADRFHGGDHDNPLDESVLHFLGQDADHHGLPAPPVPLDAVVPVGAVRPAGVQAGAQQQQQQHVPQHAQQHAPQVPPSPPQVNRRRPSPLSPVQQRNQQTANRLKKDQASPRHSANAGAIGGLAAGNMLGSTMNGHNYANQPMSMVTIEGMMQRVPTSPSLKRAFQQAAPQTFIADAADDDEDPDADFGDEDSQDDTPPQSPTAHGLMSSWQANLNIESDTGSSAPNSPNVTKRPKKVRTVLARATHNAIERRRVNTINESIQELKDLIPNNHEFKPHKAVILRKACDYIRYAQKHEDELQAEIDSLKRRLMSVSQHCKCGASAYGDSNPDARTGKGHNSHK